MGGCSLRAVIAQIVLAHAAFAPGLAKKLEADGSVLKSVVFSPSGGVTPEEPELQRGITSTADVTSSPRQYEKTFEAPPQTAVASLIRRESVESSSASETPPSAAQAAKMDSADAQVKSAPQHGKNAEPSILARKVDPPPQSANAPQSGYPPQAGYPQAGYPQAGYPQAGYPQTQPGAYPAQGYGQQSYPATLPSHGSGPAYGGHPQQQGYGYGYGPMPYGLPPYGPPPPHGVPPMGPPPPGMLPPPMGMDPNFVCDCKAYMKNADAYGSVDTAGGPKNWNFEAGIQVDMPPQCVDECNSKFKKWGWILGMSIASVVILICSIVIFRKYIQKKPDAEGGNARVRDGASDVASDGGDQH